jgi:hypothetical protein
LKNRLERIGNYLLEIPYSVFFGAIVTVSILKTGIRGIQPWADLNAIENFPMLSEDYSKNSIGLLAISKLLGINSKVSYFSLNIMLLGLVSIFIAFFAYRYFSPFLSRVIIVSFFLSPAYYVLLGNIGRHDLLTLVGLLTLVLAKTIGIRVIGLMLSLAGSPEHSISVLLLLIVISLTFKKLSDFYQYLNCLVLSLLYLISIPKIFNSNVTSSSRFSILLFDSEIQRKAFTHFIENFPIELYSYFGFYILGLVFCLLHFRGSKLFGFLVVIIFPAIANIFILDKTRDYVIALFPVWVYVIRIYFWSLFCEFFNDEKKTLQRMCISILLIIAMAFPSVEVTFEGGVRSPYSWIIEKIPIIFESQ